MQLRDYQQKAKDDIFNAWERQNANVLLIMPTGAGKTVLFTAILSQHRGTSVAIAHRQELISQMSITLARHGVYHNIICQATTRREIARQHLDEFGKIYICHKANCHIASVDKLARHKVLPPELQGMSLWVVDEAHHVLRKNKWGRVLDLFPPDTKGLGVTATGMRADGKGLGRHASGVFDIIVNGPEMRNLINRNYLTDYRVILPPESIPRNELMVSAATGDFTQTSIRNVFEKNRSYIVGDIVTHYFTFAHNLTGVTFVTDVQTAKDTADRFNEMGVNAEAVSAKTPMLERIRILRKFRAGEILMLVNVDLFGEGFDLPAIEVVIMGRPTKSYQVYAQQWGRALRLMPGKKEAIIIDCVGNFFEHHGPPDKPREVILDDRICSRNNNEKKIFIRTCINSKCYAPYLRHLKACPHCGTLAPRPVSTREIEHVDGNLIELDADILASLRGDVANIDRPIDDHVADYRQRLRNNHAKKMHEIMHVKRFEKKITKQKEALEQLRDVMACWAGYYRQAGYTDGQIYQLFYMHFGVDWLSAQTQDANKLQRLTNQILTSIGVVDAL